MTRRISVKEVIATHVSFDMAEINDYAYQTGAHQCAIYAIGDGYYASPARKSQLPRDFDWKSDGTTLGREVFFAKIESP